ncbi:DUF3134 domain-containing protein [Pleurocapsa sp. FMAR1]|uniref:DUF3134 domain-containing protein n=1 Tax=Pleurocapsa sp. FMAR1 TaxID=3040204 RepID=UPI0029C8F6E0|nr:DUF3134 domain-containing protein [Pleurocapsa sp. FMAR1]
MDKNPALVQEPRYEPAIVIPLKQEASLLDWLKASNRLIPREPVEVEKEKVKSDDDLDVLMDGDDDDFVDDVVVADDDD